MLIAVYSVLIFYHARFLRCTNLIPCFKVFVLSTDIIIVINYNFICLCITPLATNIKNTA